MKKYLLTAAFIVALAGCTQSDTDTMGGPGTTETGPEITATNADATITVTNQSSSIGGPGGAITGTDTNEAIMPEDEPRPSQPEQGAPARTESSEDPAYVPPPGATGNLSDGDLSNRPAGAPGRSEAGADASITVRADDVTIKAEENQPQQEEQPDSEPSDPPRE